MLSLHIPGSALSLINSTAHPGPVQAEEELLKILSEIQDLHRETDGYFDITIKPVYDFYQSRTETEQDLPGEIRDRVGMDKLVINDAGIRFGHRGMSIDAGGFGKGYAVRRIILILESEGVKQALISFGESLVYGLGTHPFGDSWRISLPLENTERNYHFDLKNDALSTSGNTLNNQKKFGNSGHIVNPVTLKMSANTGLVSVKVKDPVRAEAFSTAFFSAGRTQSELILNGIPDLEAIWVSTDQ